MVSKNKNIVTVEPWQIRCVFLRSPFSTASNPFHEMVYQAL